MIWLMWRIIKSGNLSPSPLHGAKRDLNETCTITLQGQVSSYCEGLSIRMLQDKSFEPLVTSKYFFAKAFVVDHRLLHYPIVHWQSDGSVSDFEQRGWDSSQGWRTTHGKWGSYVSVRIMPKMSRKWISVATPDRGKLPLFLLFKIIFVETTVV